MKEIGLKDKLKGEKLSSPKTLTGAAMLVALYTILSFFTFKLSTTLEIGFVCGMMFGPVIGGIAGAVGDTLGFIVSPNGAFFPGFTLSAFIMGFIYGIVLYKKPLTLKRIMLASFIVMFVCNLILTPIWLNMMYGTNLIALPRIIRNVIMYPINTILMYAVLKCVYSVRKLEA